MSGYQISKACEVKLDKKLIPVLPILVEILDVKEAKILIWDSYSFWNHIPMDFQLLKGPNGVANIQWFVACVSTLEGVWQNQSLMTISIAADEDSIAIDPGLNRIGTKNDRAIIYIEAGTDISRLPKNKGKTFFILSIIT